MHGLVSDDVARLDLFLATGERVAVPLKDNAYVVEAPGASSRRASSPTPRPVA
jgi:hypothetical protein